MKFGMKFPNKSFRLSTMLTLVTPWLNLLAGRVGLQGKFVWHVALDALLVARKMYVLAAKPRKS